jgi:hypothetical protein
LRELKKLPMVWALLGASVEYITFENNKTMSSWNFYPEDRFSSYEEYVAYLKEKGLALEAPEEMYKID